MDGGMVTVLVASAAVMALAVLFVIKKSVSSFKFREGTLDPNVLPSTPGLKSGWGFDDGYSAALVRPCAPLCSLACSRRVLQAAFGRPAVARAVTHRRHGCHGPDPLSLTLRNR